MKRNAAMADLRRHWAVLPRRARIALGVLGVTAVLGLTGIPYGMMMVDDREAEARRLRNATNQALGLAAMASRDHDYVVENQGRYEDALKRGLLAPQDRLEAQKRLDHLVDVHHLVRLSHELSPVRLDAAAGGYQVVNTPVRLEVGAMLDRDIFQMLEDLDDLLPGYTVVRGLRLNRQQPVTEENLDRITSGQPVAFVGGTVQLEWRTARQTDGGR